MAKVEWNDQIAEKYVKQARANLLGVGFSMERHIKESMTRSPGGRESAGGYPGVGKRKGMGGRLRASIATVGEEKDANTYAVKVGSNVEYAKFLEFGTSKMKPRPFLRLTLTYFRGKIQDLCAKGSVTTS
jgi:HK97 gp10 family phage protein